MSLKTDRGWKMGWQAAKLVLRLVGVRSSWRPGRLLGGFLGLFLHGLWLNVPWKDVGRRNAATEDAEEG
jgi:hypothetical protein